MITSIMVTGLIITLGSKKLIQNQSFEDAYIKRFNEVMTAYFDIFIAELDYVSSALFPHAERNFKKWGILDKYVWPNPPEMVEANTYSKQITYLKTYMINRKKLVIKRTKYQRLLFIIKIYNKEI